MSDRPPIKCELKGWSRMERENICCSSIVLKAQEVRKVEKK